jgi:hypothetical protein
MKNRNKLITLVVSIALVVGCLDTLHAQTNAFAVDPASLSFTTPTGASPLPKILNVGTTGAPVAFVLQVTGGLTCSQIVNYQIASPTSTTPTQVTVAAQTPSLPAGTYNCGITLTASGLASKDVPITITIGGGSGTSGSLSVSTTSISLSAASGGQPAATTLRITNSNAASAINFTAVPTSSGWLQISTNTSVPAAGFVDMQVQANPAGLAVGSYDGNITITPAGGTAISVAVNFSVTGNPALQVSQGGSAVSAVNFAYQIGTALPATQSLNLSSSSQTTQLTCTVAQLGSNFLVVLPTGSVTTPQTLQLQIASTAAQLPAGNYTASISLSCPNASNSSVTIPVNLLVSTLPLLTAGTLPSTFTYQTGGPNPAVQTVSIGTTSTAVAFTTSVTAGQGWLTVTPSAGTASAAVPQVLTLAVNPAGLGAGNYTGSVTVTSSGAGNSLTIPVALTVTTGTILSATPMGFAFSYQTTGGAPAPGSRQITISSPVDVVFNISIAYSQCSSWLSLNTTSGTAGPFGTPVTLSVNPAGIAPPAHCAATLSITASSAPNTINIPVTLDVSANPILGVSTGALTLNGQLGAGNSQPASFSVSSSDSITALPFSVTSPATWLFISPSAGTTAANIQVQANTSAAGLQVGPNTTRVTVSSPSLPSPGYIDIPVTLNLTSNANLTVDKSSLTFSQTQGGAPPAAQTLSIAVAGVHFRRFRIGVLRRLAVGDANQRQHSGPTDGQRQRRKPVAGDLQRSGRDHRAGRGQQPSDGERDAQHHFASDLVGVAGDARLHDRNRLTQAARPDGPGHQHRRAGYVHCRNHLH